MKLSMKVSLGVLAAALAASAAQANTVTKCPQGTHGVYYVLYKQQVSSALIMAPTPYIYKLDPTGIPYPIPAEQRVFHELMHNPFEEPVFYAMCSNDVATFEIAKGIHKGEPVAKLRGKQSELHHVLDNVTNQIVGTEWIDFLEPFDQGGAIAGQSYWRCGISQPTPIPVVANYGAFASGLDLGAINDTSEENKELYYMHHIRERFLEIFNKRMLQGNSVFPDGCASLLTKADFVDMPNLADAQIFWLAFDPDTGFGDTK